jgi:hypothetical protein
LFDCYRFHGDILDGRGHWLGAQKAYAEAVALALDLPAGYYSWGVALVRHSDLAGAEAKLKDANQRSQKTAKGPKADCYEQPLLGDTSSHLWSNPNFV